MLPFIVSNFHGLAIDGLDQLTGLFHLHLQQKIWHLENSIYQSGCRTHFLVVFCVALGVSIYAPDLRFSHCILVGCIGTKMCLDFWWLLFCCNLCFAISPAFAFTAYTKYFRALFELATRWSCVEVLASIWIPRNWLITSLLLVSETQCSKLFKLFRFQTRLYVIQAVLVSFCP